MGRLSGKQLTLRKLSGREERFILLAIDQRLPFYQLYRLVAPARPGLSREALAREVVQFKALVMKALGFLSTGVLLDPFHGEAALGRFLLGVELLLTLEDYRFCDTMERFCLRRAISRLGVRSTVRAGTQGVKLLVWYRLDALGSVRRGLREGVRKVGQACHYEGHHEGLGFIIVLAILPHPLISVVGETEVPSELWEEVLRGFAGPEFGVDLYKLPSVEGMLVLFRRTLLAPWIPLSGGREAKAFPCVLEAALAWRARGFLAERAFWWEARSTYPDWASVQAGLERAKKSLKEAVDLFSTLYPLGVA